MDFTVKRFQELTIDELFRIYKLRVNVFVVEQNCPYPEVDDLDLSAVHVIMCENDSIKGYLRVLPPDTVCDCAAIGRVISTERGKGNGAILLNKGIKTAVEFFRTDRIKIEAQTYAKGFYEKAGFVQTSDEFLEDGIPHIRMQLDL